MEFRTGRVAGYALLVLRHRFWGTGSAGLLGMGLLGRTRALICQGALFALCRVWR